MDLHQDLRGAKVDVFNLRREHRTGSFHFVAAMVSKSETMEADGAVEEIVPWRLAAQ